MQQMVDLEVSTTVISQGRDIAGTVSPFKRLRALSLLLLLLLMGSFGLILAGARARIAVAHGHAVAETLREGALDSLDGGDPDPV